MLTLFYSIILSFTLQHSALSIEPVQNQEDWISAELSKHTKPSSSVYANLALKGHTQKIGKPAEHIALIETSLYKNPYRTSLYKLRTEVMKKSSYSSFEIPMSTHLLTAFKPLFTFLIFAFLLLFTAKLIGRLYNHRLNFTKAEPNLGFYALSSSLITILFFSLFLWHFSTVNRPWTCITAAGTEVYSAPSNDSTIVRSLPAGSCLPLTKKTDKWAGFSTARVSGWVELSKLQAVRGS